MIDFLCPNGHKIRCSADRAGQAAKCPKCGVKFVVPQADEASLLEAGDSGSSVSQSPSDPGASGLKSGPSSGLTARDQIEFLCPNGHRLHGPRHLQGQPGQCPECGCKFRVPTYDDAEEAESLPETAAAREDSAVNLPDAKRAGDSGKRPPPPSVETLRAALRPGGSSKIQRPQRAASLGELLSRLWAKKADGAVVEVHLSNGQTFVPDRFAGAASEGSHAVFAVKEPDGSYTLTAIAWETVSGLVVRHLHELPDEFSQ